MSKPASTVTTTSTSAPPGVKASGVRLIFYGGAREVNNDGKKRREGISANATFLGAAQNLRRAYRDFATNGRMERITTAADMVGIINSYDDGAIASMDVISHGSPWTLNFSKEDDVNAGFYVNDRVKVLVNTIIAPSLPGQVNVFGDGSASFEAIKWEKFAVQARIEFHGCNAANPTDPHLPVYFTSAGADVIVAKSVSESLAKAGRTQAYVIGHASPSTPNMESSLTEDYRHGKRIIYSGGKVLTEIRKPGHIPEDSVLDLLQKQEKAQQQEKAD